LIIGLDQALSGRDSLPQQRVAQLAVVMLDATKPVTQAAWQSIKLLPY
jgi:hypothetical protein